MQPTEIQVQRCIDALVERPPDLIEVEAHEAGLPDGLVEFLAGSPGVRLERMADARMRMAAGVQPSDDDLAARMVGRLVCDRLR